MRLQKLTSDPEEWENEPMALTAGALGDAGGLLGSTVAQAFDIPYSAVVTGLTAGATVVVGFAVVALLE